MCRHCGEAGVATYDLSNGMARALSQQFLGRQLDLVPHTGIVAFGREYFFSGGIQDEPQAYFAANVQRLHEAVELGTTEVPRELFEEFLAERAADFTAEKYSLLRWNCNHFTEECAQFLCGRSIPAAIREVPEIVLATPMGAMFAAMGTTAFVAARGEAATAVHCGLSVVPVRMAYDTFVNKVRPPPPA